MVNIAWIIRRICFLFLFFSSEAIDLDTIDTTKFEIVLLFYPNETENDLACRLFGFFDHLIQNSI